ncbi:hypothetical protein [Azospirillum doebereinerae]|uniref:Uncharacterized protein n=1 Tax=Azospirillum doebereinerae TaxID=92933 RepID=A0A3S0V0I9_9PROT|nr:hypothetical protein [Azospirillum doebereinerae]RUQ69242.1 hypothetical protein EJ913_15825 [Azospirillum doebereinerae]
MEIRSVSGTSVNRLAAPSTSEAAAVGTDESSADSTAQRTSTATAGYISPYLQYDQGARVAVMLFRDTDTGETQDQIPSRRVVEEYRRAASRPQPETGGKGASDSSGPSVAGQNGATARTAASGTVSAARGVSFASSGTATTSASVASFGASNGNTASAAPAVSVPAPGVSVPAPPPAGGGSSGGSPGGLVSMTV